MTIKVHEIKVWTQKSNSLFYEKVHHDVIGKFVTFQHFFHLVQYICNCCITNYGTHQGNKIL
jgi:hypothetical protein